MKNQNSRFLKLISALALFGALSISAQSALLPDGGFEEDANNTPWGFTPTAGLTTNSPLFGNQSAILSNQGLNGGDFAVVFQTILLDGSDFAVGDEIALSGFAQIVSQLGSLDSMYIELAFRNSAEEEVFGGIGDVDFANAVVANLLFDTIEVQSLATSSLIIPEFVTSNNGDTATTKGIRIALALRVDGRNDLTQATFDNIRLTKVSSPSIFALLVIAAGFVAARKRVFS